MSAGKVAATAAGRALLKAGSRSLPATARGGAGRGSKGARCLSSVGVSLNQHHHRGAQGALIAGVSCAALVGVAALLESEDLGGVLPAPLLEKLQLQQQVSAPKALARIEEFYAVDGDKPLGRGQFGTVCKATDKVTGEVVAVKCVPRNKASEAHIREEADVHREAAGHPNVVGMKGIFADEDCWYMVMQLADGGELYDRLTTEGFGLDDREAVAKGSDDGGEGERAAAGAVGKVLLADFGSSFRMRGDGNGGKKTVKEYTVAYSAPEVVDHSPEISAKADVWSLGVIAYVMVKGHHPFDPTSDADDEEISENILYSDPDWDGMEPKAATLIRQMLARDPEDRPSAREVLQNAWLQQLQ
eukprot:g7456.t1